MHVLCIYQFSFQIVLAKRNNTECLKNFGTTLEIKKKTLFGVVIGFPQVSKIILIHHVDQTSDTNSAILVIVSFSSLILSFE